MRNSQRQNCRASKKSLCKRKKSLPFWRNISKLLFDKGDAGTPVHTKKTNPSNSSFRLFFILSLFFFQELIAYLVSFEHFNLNLSCWSDFVNRIRADFCQLQITVGDKWPFCFYARSRSIQTYILGTTVILQP